MGLGTYIQVEQELYRARRRIRTLEEELARARSDVHFYWRFICKIWGAQASRRELEEEWRKINAARGGPGSDASGGQS